MKIKRYIENVIGDFAEKRILDLIVKHTIIKTQILVANGQELSRVKAGLMQLRNIIDNILNGVPKQEIEKQLANSDIYISDRNDRP